MYFSLNSHQKHILITCICNYNHTFLTPLFVISYLILPPRWITTVQRVQQHFTWRKTLLKEVGFILLFWSLIYNFFLRDRLETMIWIKLLQRLLKVSCYIRRIIVAISIIIIINHFSFQHFHLHGSSFKTKIIVWQIRYKLPDSQNIP